MNRQEQVHEEWSPLSMYYKGNRAGSESSRDTEQYGQFNQDVKPRKTKKPVYYEYVVSMRVGTPLAFSSCRGHSQDSFRVRHQ